MGVKRLDHVGVVVEDLDGAIAFFTELGLQAEGKMAVADAWVDQVVGLPGVDVEICMMGTPDGHSRLELTAFRNPPVRGAKDDPPNTLGLRRLMFAVDDIKDTVARLEKHGGKLIGEIGQYEDMFLLCYLRGPSGIIVALAEELF